MFCTATSAILLLPLSSFQGYYLYSHLSLSAFFFVYFTSMESENAKITKINVLLMFTLTINCALYYYTTTFHYKIALFMYFLTRLLLLILLIPVQRPFHCFLPLPVSTKSGFPLLVILLWFRLKLAI